MRFLVQHMDSIKDPLDRAYLAIQALHPLRLEEVLGLQAADIDQENTSIHICRAVTHPTRNQPEIKDTKTQSSARTIGLSALAVPYLPSVKDGEFVFGGKKPLSYTQVRKMCDRIKRDTGFRNIQKDIPETLLAHVTTPPNRTDNIIHRRTKSRQPPSVGYNRLLPSG